MRLLFLILLLVAPLVAEEGPMARVGQPLRIEEIYIPGDQVAPAPRRDREPPLVVRVLDVRPAADGFRYDFEVQGLDPGSYDLADFLEGSDLPAIPLTITTDLPEGPPLPQDLAPAPLPKFGGYRTFLVIAGVFWLAGLLALILVRRKKPTTSENQAPPPSLAERLQPLVAAASTGDLDAEGRAKLERLVIGYWRERIPAIAGLPPSEALVQLRRHDEASPLLLALERWIHAPDRTRPDNLDDLLAPYRS
ncbi:hypothetical protein [Haloferula sargassicola]|uniref:Protein BatD n=1 Tax=Haloferula sargassicola TaxID=490096 RepID=A0ABP9UV39_9BACT